MLNGCMNGGQENVNVCVRVAGAFTPLVQDWSRKDPPSWTLRIQGTVDDTQVRQGLVHGARSAVA